MDLKDVCVECVDLTHKLTPQICLDCKYFKCYFCKVPRMYEIQCKKGDKCILIDKPFACGQFKCKYKWKPNKKLGGLK